VSGQAAQDEKVPKNLDHVDGFQLAIDADCQALMRELVNHPEHAVLPPVMGSGNRIFLHLSWRAIA
jgi:hypothetical protein